MHQTATNGLTSHTNVKPSGPPNRYRQVDRKWFGLAPQWRADDGGRAMKCSSVAKALGGASLIFVPLAAASAQVWVPGSEITGQSIQVETNGVVNTVYFDPGGVARIATPSGNMVQGSWSVANEMLCLETGA